MLADHFRNSFIEIQAAVSLAEDGREKEAITRLTRALDRGVFDATSISVATLLRGELRYLHGEPEKAITDLNAVARSLSAKVSQRGAALLAMANCYEELGNPSAVIAAMEKAVRLGFVSGNAVARTIHNFGVRCNLRGQPEKGFVYFDSVCRKEAVAAPGIFCNAVINRGCYLGDLGHYGLAEDDFRRVIAYPNVSAEYFGRAHYNLGHMYWLMAKYDVAVSAFTKAIESDAIPTSMRLLAHCKRAHSHQRAGRVEVAVKLLDEFMPIPAVESRSDYENILFYAGATLLGARMHSEAEDLFARTAAIHGGSAIMKARSLWSLGYSQCVRGNASDGVPLMLEAREALSALHESRFLELIDKDLQRFADPGS